MLLDRLKFYSKNNFLTSILSNRISLLSAFDDGALLDQYNNEFLSVFKAAYTKSKFYKSFYKLHGISQSDIKDLSDIIKLPIISKSDIKNHIDNIYLGSKIFKVSSYTSGTSGSPLKVYRSPLAILKEQAYLVNYRNQCGLQRSPILSIRGTIDKNSLYKFDKASNVLYISSYNLSNKNIFVIHEIIKNFQPKAAEAYPSSIYNLCQLLSENGLILNIPLVFTSSETLYDFQRDKIEIFLNCQIFDWYGNAERTICLAQNKEKKYVPLPLYSINEYFKDHIITTGLINKDFPLIRYRVDDEVAVDGVDFIKNIVSPNIKRIEGRIDDSIQLRDGSLVGRLDIAFKGVNHIEYAQIHQYDLFKPLNVKLVTAEKFNDADFKDLNNNFKKLLGSDTPLEYSFCQKEDLTYSSRNKFKLVIKH